MDHLATRMRRHSDRALILAGNEAARHPAGPFPLVDVVRAAISEIEDYDRITLTVQQGVLVSGSAAADTVHLLAELLENATAFSAPATQVTMSGQAVRDGRARITITDRGTGMPREQLCQLNWRLAHPPAADVATSRRMGLFAVAHLAARHGIRVVLSQPPDGGTTAEVSLPAALISHDAAPRGWLRQAATAPPAGTGERANGRTPAWDVPFSALRIAAKPDPPVAPEPGVREAVPLTLSAPVPAPDPGTATADQENGHAPAQRVRSTEQPGQGG